MEAVNKYYLNVFKNHYVDFNGRLGRKPYWMFVLFNFVVAMVLSIIDQIFGMPILSAVYSLAILLPSLGLSIRRLHDIGKSGWYLLLSLIPLVGFIILLVYFVKESMPADNEYGSVPMDN